MLIKYGNRRFDAAFVDTYEKVCLKDGGDLSDETIQNKFINRLRERFKNYSVKRVVDKLASLTIEAANKYGGQYTNDINDLLQCFHIELVRKGYGERKMIKELQKVQDIIDINESFNVWSTKLKSVRD